MKIVYILRSFAMMAGIERVEADKMNWLARQGFDVSLITYEQGRHPLAFPLHETIRHINIDACFFVLSRYSLPVRLFKTMMLRKKFKKELRHFVDSHHPDIIVTTTTSLKIAGTILAVKGDARTIMESHQVIYSVMQSFSHRHNLLKKAIASVYDAHALGRVGKYDLLVTLTQGDANDWQKYAKAIAIVPNPVTIYPDEVKSHDGHGRRIISAGRLTAQKGYDILIDAFSMFTKRCPGWRLDIFGSGEDEAPLREQIKERGLEQAVTINAPTSSIYDEYQNSEFYVMSSRYEGFGLVLVEAMSCGIPCVSFSCKYGPADIIDDGRDGLLAKDGDTRDLAEKMTWMVTHTDERLKMGEEARKRAAHYKTDNIMQRWTEIFDSLYRKHAI